MPLPFAFDFKNPDYTAVYEWRRERLDRIRSKPECLPSLYAYYAAHPIDFIEDWGMTFDPRNAGTELPAAMPFILFPRQREWLEWALEMWRAKEPGLTRKSRDVGASWLAVSLAASICMFNSDVYIGFGSRKEEYVDKSGSPKALFFKARQFIQMVPREFRGGWDRVRNSAHMRITFPLTGSVITGEAGDNIGRGDRTSLYFFDESAFAERPQLIEASLSATTDCRIDMSSSNGPATPFAQKCRSYPARRVFSFHWRDDPRKNDDWYAKKCEEINDPLIVARELDMDDTASLPNIVIPQEWVQAAIDAHEKLGLIARGEKRGALDVADEGKDANAFVSGQGYYVREATQWSGKGSDIFETVEHAFELCDFSGLASYRFDSDGIGAGARGDARVINVRRESRGSRKIKVEAWRGSAAVADPEEEIFEGRLNKDYFANAKAQGWWFLRKLFQNTYRAINGKPYDPEQVITLSSEIAELAPLCLELSQVQYLRNGSGLMLIDKKPEGAKSPNLADALMIYCAPSQEELGFFDL